MLFGCALQLQEAEHLAERDLETKQKQAAMLSLLERVRMASLLQMPIRSLDHRTTAANMEGSGHPALRLPNTFMCEHDTCGYYIYRPGNTIMSVARDMLICNL